MTPGAAAGARTRAIAGGLAIVLLAGAAATRTASTKRVKKHKEVGLASWYGPGFHGKQTASGEIYDMNALTAAHRTLPLGTIVEVRNLENGRTVEARINDRGPQTRKRIIDLSLAAAEALGIEQAGLARVRLTVVAAADAPPLLYWVQVGAFQEEENARALLAKVERRWPRAEIQAESGWFQVRVPSGEKKRAADSLRRALDRAGYDTVLVRQPKSKK